MVKFRSLPLSLVPMDSYVIAFREHVYAQRPRGAIGYRLYCELLDVVFPLPLRVGKRKTFVGRMTDKPFYELGGTEEKGIFVPFEAPRIPINARYQLIYSFAGGRETVPPLPALGLRFAQDMRRDARIRRLIAIAQEKDSIATSEAMPQADNDDDGDDSD